MITHKDNTAPATWDDANGKFTKQDTKITAQQGGVGTTEFQSTIANRNVTPPPSSAVPSCSFTFLSCCSQPYQKVFQTHANPSLLEWYLDTHHKFEYSSSSKSDYSIYGYFPQAFACWVNFNPKYSAKLATNCGYSYFSFNSPLSL